MGWKARWNDLSTGKRVGVVAGVVVLLAALGKAGKKPTTSDTTSALPLPVTATAAPAPSTAHSERTAAIAPPVAPSATAPPADTGVWARTDVVELDAKLANEERFWSLFDDAVREREQPAVDKLKEEQPATWPGHLAELKQKLAAERKQHLDGITSTLLRVGANVDLSDYNATSHSFTATIPGVVEVSGDDDHPEERWSVAFGAAPFAKREAEKVPFGKPGEPDAYFLKYKFAGGQPIKWTVKVEPAKADDFVKTVSLTADVLFLPRTGIFDRGHPDKQGFVAQDTGTTGAGRAIVGTVRAWRLVTSDGRVVASWEAK